MSCVISRAVPQMNSRARLSASAPTRADVVSSSGATCATDQLALIPQLNDRIDSLTPPPVLCHAIRWWSCMDSPPCMISPTIEKGIDEYLRQSNAVLSVLMHHTCDRLEAAQAKVVRPDGGFYVFPLLEQCPRVRKLLADRPTLTGPELAADIMEQTGVSLLPGSEFRRPVDEMSVRIAPVDFDGAQSMKVRGDTAPESCCCVEYAWGVPCVRRSGVR